MGVSTAADVQQAIEIIRRDAPRIITFRPADKYNTATTQAIMARVRAEYQLVSTIGDVEVHRLAQSR